MNNYVQPGRDLDLVAPVGGVVSGSPVKLGSIIAVPGTSAAEGKQFAGTTEGVFDLPAKTAQAWAGYPTVYWDDAAKVFTTTAGGNTKAGHAIADKDAAAATGRIKLVPTV
jgi:predicted RecA/RadA family phage recombinase